MHYVIGDVHGCFDDMMLLLEKIESQDEESQIIFVGDFVDRGPKVWETLCWFMQNITVDGKYQSVRGNHEQIALDWLQRKTERSPYGFDKLLIKQIISKEKPYPISDEDRKPYIEFFEGLPFFKRLQVTRDNGEVKEFVIVHAYYNSHLYPEQSETFQWHCLWERNVQGHYLGDEIIVHGHTPTIDVQGVFHKESGDREGMICYRKNMINLDGGCCYFPYEKKLCMLGAICLETLEEFYPYTVEERLQAMEKLGG